jgi:hypothetical protein
MESLGHVVNIYEVTHVNVGVLLKISYFNVPVKEILY